MGSQSQSRGLMVFGSLTVLAALAVFGWLAVRHQGETPTTTTTDPASLPFRECATEVGITWRMNFLPNEQGETFRINLYDHGSGLAVGDFDGDGLDDIYFCNQLGRNALYRNKGDGTFEDVTDKAGVALGDRVCVGATWVDYDNDGKLDLYVTSTRGGNVLFKNMGGGKFKDITKEAGLEHIGHSQTGVFFDFDGDGYLDLFLTNTAEWTTDTFDQKNPHFVGKGDLGGVSRSKKEHNVLYRNNGNGTFTDVTEKAGLKGRGWAGDAVAFDYNGDGKPDLFVTCMFGRAQLYRNNGNGTFTDVTLEVLGKTPWGGVGTRVFDLDNSGRLSLYAVDMHSDMWMGLDYDHASREQALRWEKRRFAYYSGPNAERDPSLILREEELGRLIGFKHEEVLFGNACYRNDGGGKFTEVDEPAGLETFWPWGIATGDFDNDGSEDLFVPSGMGYPFYYWPNYLLMNQGNGTFRNRAAEMGVEPPPRGTFQDGAVAGKPAARSSRCAATADFRGVGLLDIVTNNFNDQPYYYRNQSPPRNYVAFRLRGAGAPKSNRDAIGAVVRVYRGNKVLTRQVLGSCGYLSQSSHVLHFGLGDSPAIDRVEVTWPSGLKQTLKDFRVNARNDVIEPAGAAQ